ncbi:hypothetical protein F4778DRAFT_563340 [Xylariomycetidae sp. FL2044]|nr:hypothetical protein F4778DRAFT_563340 [Xylariomycetidae sp. FL2044]
MIAYSDNSEQWGYTYEMCLSHSQLGVSESDRSVDILQAGMFYRTGLITKSLVVLKSHKFITAGTESLGELSRLRIHCYDNSTTVHYGRQRGSSALGSSNHFYAELNPGKVLRSWRLDGEVCLTLVVVFSELSILGVTNARRHHANQLIRTPYMFTCERPERLGRCRSWSNPVEARTPQKGTVHEAEALSYQQQCPGVRYPSSCLTSSPCPR